MSGDPPDLTGKKCAACGHAISWHNSLGYCRRGWHQQGKAATCFGSCGWHVSAGQEALENARRWDEEHGAGEVRRRMGARGQSTDGVFR